MGYDARNPAGKIIAIPNQNMGVNKATPINPGIRNAAVFSAISIDVILAVSPTIATHAACFSQSDISNVIRENV